MNIFLKPNERKCEPNILHSVHLSFKDKGYKKFSTYEKVEKSIFKKVGHFDKSNSRFCSIFEPKIISKLKI